MASAALRILLFLCYCIYVYANAENNNNGKTFWSQVEPSWGSKNVKIYNNGKTMDLCLTNDTGSAVQSYSHYLFGHITVKLKLVPRNSAGTVTTFYIYSIGEQHDEVDLEFLGNSTGEPYTLHTNVYVKGDGAKEQQFRLWFDPTVDFHNYTILWNKFHIVFSVDGIPIRVFRNFDYVGIPYPEKQPMRLYASIWNADDWATQGGRVKTDWSAAPFIATYQDLDLDACKWQWEDKGSLNECTYNWKYWWNSNQYSYLTDAQKGQLEWAKNFTIYDYCTDYARFKNKMPPECYMTQE